MVGPVIVACVRFLTITFHEHDAIGGSACG
jgi:hypothetical protein